MRRSHCTLSCRHVTHWAVHGLLQALAWTVAPGCVSPLLLVQMLVRAAVERRSLSAVVVAARTAPSWQTVRQALARALPAEPLDLLPALLRALQHRLPKALTRRPRTAAIDLHLRPYYGAKHTRGVYRGQPKAGTKTFFAYATLLVLRRGQSYTIGLTPVRNGEEQTAILERLLAQAEAKGVRLRRLLVDRGFYAATTLQWLQQRGLPFILPLVRRGKAGRTTASSTGTAQFFVPRRRGWHTYTFTARPRRGGRKQPAVTVTFDVCVLPRSQQGPRRRTRGPLVYACHGTRHWSPRQVMAAYRRRFGIETSYRQLGQSLAATCSRQPTYRLLLVAIALVLRNLWLWVHGRYLGERTADGWLFRWERLRLRSLTRWIMWVLDRQLRMQPQDLTISRGRTKNPAGG
jgi:Transposase DDE domain